MLKKFEYFRPKSVQKVLSFLKEYGQEAKILAGGTDLLVQMEREIIAPYPKYLIDIRGIPQLAFIKEESKGRMRIGAATTLGTLERTPSIKDKFPLLYDAILELASMQVRNLATIGGNLCNAAPSADLAPPLLALGAKVKTQGLDGQNMIDLKELFIEPGKTCLDGKGILTEIHIPPMPSFSGGAFKKFGRTSKDIAIVCVGAVLTLDGKDGICKDVKIGLGAVAPTPIRAVKAEEVLRGHKLTEEKVLESAEIASQESKPISDIRASEEYRRELVKVLTKRALFQAKADVKAVSGKDRR